VKAAPMLLATIALSLPAVPAPTVGASHPLRVIVENAPAIMIPAHTATLMKRELDQYALFVDVDAAPDTQSTLRVDAHVPLLVYDAPETFDQTFLGRMDEALRAKRLRFTDGVVLVSSSPRTALEAAELMREHGYGLVFAVTSRQYAGR
jgi:hypothetical protein